MAKVLSTVNLNPPYNSVGVAINGTFVMSEWYTLSGNGQAPAVVLHWMWDQGIGIWTDIPTTGSSGLVADGGSQASAVANITYSRTITCKSVGSFVIKAEAVASTPATMDSPNTPAISVDVVPNAPTDAFTISKTDVQIVMGWTDNSDNETGFKVYRNGLYVTTVDPDSTQYTFVGLSPSTLYTLGVKATRNDVDSDEATLEETTKVDSTTLYENQPTLGNTFFRTGGTQKGCQTFMPIADHRLYKVKLRFYNNGVYSGNTTLALYHCDGSPTTQIAAAPPVASSSISFGTDKTFYFTPTVNILAGVEYAFVVTTDGGDGSSSYIAVYGINDATDHYTRGEPQVYSGSSWDSYTGTPDWYFFEWGVVLGEGETNIVEHHIITYEPNVFSG